MLVFVAKSILAFLVLGCAVNWTLCALTIIRGAWHEAGRQGRRSRVLWPTLILDSFTLRILKEPVFVGWILKSWFSTKVHFEAFLDAHNALTPKQRGEE